MSQQALTAQALHLGRARGAHVAAVQDQPVVRFHPVGRRHALEQLQLHLQRVAPRRQAGAVAHAEDVGVHRHRRLAEGHVEHHVGRFAAHAGQLLQRLARMRHLAAMLAQQDLASQQQVPRLVAVQADRADLLAQRVEAERQHLLRRVGEREQPPRGLVDAHVGGLGRQQHRAQQLEHAGVLQLAGRLRVGRLERGEEGLDVGGFHHRGLSASARPAAVAPVPARCRTGSARSRPGRRGRAGRPATRRRRARQTRFRRTG